MVMHERFKCESEKSNCDDNVSHRLPNSKLTTAKKGIACAHIFPQFQLEYIKQRLCGKSVSP